jgi:hypothetical protein
LKGGFQRNELAYWTFCGQAPAGHVSAVLKKTRFFITPCRNSAGPAWLQVGMTAFQAGIYNQGGAGLSKQQP